jgi:hypothetical protein
MSATLQDPYGGHTPSSSTLGGSRPKGGCAWFHLPPALRCELVSAPILHDIGYAYAYIGFHTTDGASQVGQWDSQDLCVP